MLNIQICMRTYNTSRQSIFKVPMLTQWMIVVSGRSRIRRSNFLTRCSCGGDFPYTYLSFDFDLQTYYTRWSRLAFSFTLKCITIPITSRSSRQILRLDFQKSRTRFRQSLQNMYPPTAMVSNDKFLHNKDR